MPDVSAPSGRGQDLIFIEGAGEPCYPDSTDCFWLTCRGRRSTAAAVLPWYENDVWVRLQLDGWLEIERLQSFR